MAARLLIYDNLTNPTLQRGIARYFRHVRQGLVAVWGAQVTVLAAVRDDYAPARYLPVVRPPFHLPGRRSLGKLQARIVATWLRPPVIFTSYYGSLGTRAAEVVTAYDMIHERFPTYFDPHLPAVARLVAEKRRCFERAACIFAISEATALDVRTFYPHIEAARIVVTPLGVEPEFFAPPPLPLGERPYFLYVGNRERYKNFLRLLDGFGRSGLARTFDLRVISPLGQRFTAIEEALLAQYGLTDQVHVHLNVSDEALRGAYAGAAAFVYPSEYEGFGLPILEAMASGTLVATSNRSSMPEVGGEVAWYFEPTDPDSIAGTLLHLADLPSAERQARVAAGRAHARTFTWDRCQQQTNAIFRALLEP